ncbi:MAG: RnfABCDGE type electron transport complex subunit D [Defluviitaleaceae bacterium]|nr:RnfABCDGE type electron transport complex subunit D [Defluviitaleaceae bacterium]
MAENVANPSRPTQAMVFVLIALLPAAGLGVYFFGLQALLIILVTVTSCVAFEAIYQKFAKKPITITDLSAVTTGLLMAMVMPPAIPLWMPVVGAFVAIIIVKQLFGGLGKNFLNPALAGWGFLAVSYSSAMLESYTYPLAGWLNSGELASATPLYRLNTMGVPPVIEDYIVALFGNVPGAIGTTATIALVLGGLFLLVTKTISWHIPVSFIATVFGLTFIMGEYASYQLIIGGLMLGAIFMATDPATSPKAWYGKLIFGVGCGVLVALIRLFGGYAEGMAFAILLMNLAVPLIDRIKGFKRRRAI